MDIETKTYIDGLNSERIPWNRMFTAYGTADHYSELLAVLEQTFDIEEWNKTFNQLSDFEHQSTMFPPAPFVLVFLVRILKRLLQESADDIAEKLIGQFMYYTDVCNDAEAMEHAEPLSRFSDLLDDKYLLSEDDPEEDLQKVYGDPDAVPDELFFSFYYYSKIVLSGIPDILDQYGKFSAESKQLRNMFRQTKR
ncbi:MAG: hypothetical protein IKS32_02415 [Solobacterium sp.]|nr:hypothetical protein [Solobacterium sp.]